MRAIRAQPEALPVVARADAHPPDPPLRRASTVCARALPLLATALATLIAFHRLSDWDTWWHLAVGRWIAWHRAIPRTDTLTFTTANRPWLNLQWLYELTLYGLFRAGGADLLVVSAALAFTLAIWLLTRNVGRFVGPVGTAVLAAWVTVIAGERFEVRPEMVSFVLLQILLWLFATADRDRGRRLWLVPLVMIVWVNSHALSVIGFFVIACHMVSAILARRGWLPSGWRAAAARSPAVTSRTLVSSTVAIATPLINPYGLAGALFPLQLFAMVDKSSAAYQAVAELRPPFSDYFPTLAVYAYRPFFLCSIALVTAASLLTLRSNRRSSEVVKPSRGARRRGSSRSHVEAARDGVDRPAARAECLDVADLLVFCGLAYLSFLARRNIALFAMGVAPLVAQCLVIVRRLVPRPLQRVGAVVAVGAPMILVPALIAAGWFIVSNRFYRWDLEVREFGTGVLDVNFPVRAAAFIKALDLPPRLYNDVGSGGYLAWTNTIDGGVYIDGRLGVGDTTFFSSYVAGSNAPDLWQRDADRFGVQTALLFYRGGTVRQPLIRWLLAEPRWALVYFDEAAVVFLKREGHDELIARARTEFAKWNDQTVADLTTPVSSWQWPMARATALSNYAAVLEIVGDGSQAVEFYNRFLALDPHPKAAAQAHVHLAAYFAGAGDVATARAHLARAAQADPHNERVREMQNRLGR